MFQLMYKETSSAWQSNKEKLLCKTPYIILHFRVYPRADSQAKPCRGKCAVSSTRKPKDNMY